MFMTIRKLTVTTAIATFLAASFAAGFALAADETPAPAGQTGQAAQTGNQTARPSPADRLFQRYDTDKNGEISRQEVDAARAARIKAMDSNGDGRVSREERRAYMQHQMEERRAASFAALDTNHDGKIDLEEYQADAAKRFARLDRDGNGGLTQAELYSPRRMMGGGNRN